MNSAPTSGSLENIFNPSSVAIVGVSPDREISWGRITTTRIVESDFAGTVNIVGKGPIGDDRVTWAPTLGELPEVPDLVIIAVPATHAVGVLAEASALGVGGAIVYSSGFSEMGTEEGVQLEAELVAAAGPMPFLGPNCLGMVNKAASLIATTTAFVVRPGGIPGPVSIVTQSGALGFVLADLLERCGVGYNSYASVGNSSVLDATAVAAELIGYDQTQVAVVYLEGSINATGLAALGEKARSLGKSVVVLSVGRTAAGQRAALSHTSAAAGDHLLLEALCRQHGIVLVDKDEDVVTAVLHALRGKPVRRHPNLGILTMSGGAGGLLADGLADIDVSVRQFSEEFVASIRDMGIVDAGVSNPVDLGGNFMTIIDKLPALIERMCAQDDIDGLVLYLTFGDRGKDEYNKLAAIIRDAAKPAWFIWACPPGDAVQELAMPGIVFTTASEFLHHMEVVTAGDGPRAEVDRPVVRKAQSNQQSATVLTELKASAVTRAHGIEHVGTVASSDPAAAVAQVAENGWSGPFVLKIDAADLPHRAKAGALRLNVSLADLASELDDLARKAGTLSNDPDWTLVVQPMLSHSREAALGFVRDQVFGPAIVLGAGGPDAENPRAARRALLLPADPADIEDVALWAGIELELPTDDTMTALRGIASLVAERPQITEVDVNPLIVHDGRLIAVDALIISTDD